MHGIAGITDRNHRNTHVGGITSGGVLTASSSAVITVKLSRHVRAGLLRSRVHWAARTGGYDSEAVQDVMPRAVERRFESNLPAPWNG